MLIISLKGESIENIDMDFLADLASLGSKLMKKKAKSLCKVVPQGRIQGGVVEGAYIMLIIWAG